MRKGVHLIVAIILSFVTLTSQAKPWYQSLHWKETKQPIVKYHSNAIPCFNVINTKGFYTLNLIPTHKKPHMTVIGNKEAIKTINTYVDHNTLFIRVAQQWFVPYSKPFTINLYLNNNLKKLTVAGIGNVIGKKIRSKDLVIIQNGDGNINLSGSHIGLDKVNGQSDGNITVTGVRTNKLVVEQVGLGQINLSGKIGLKKLDVMTPGPVTIKGLKRSVPTQLDAESSGPINLIGGGYINFSRIYHTGSDNLTFKRVRSSNLRMSNIGSGNLTLRGYVGLNYLYHSHHGSVYIDKVKKSQPLYINTTGSGKITLLGETNLRSLIHDGKTNVTVRWADSPMLAVTGHGHGTIKLAGLAHELDARIDHHILLDAKYLRADKIFVHTKDGTLAELWPRWRLFARAIDKSKIFYYHKPKFLGKYSANSASILQMSY